MSNSISRIVGAGRTFLSPTDLFVQANTNDSGQVEIVLPNTKLIFGSTDTNTAYNYVGIRFIDSGNNSSVNNIVVYAFDDDLINGQQTLTINTNGSGGLINLIGEGQWIFDENNSSSGGGGVIDEGAGAGSSVRVNANNTASGDYSTALGKLNSVSSYGSFVGGVDNLIEESFSNSCCSPSPSIPQLIGSGARNSIGITCSNYYIVGGNIIVGGLQNTIASGLNNFNFIGGGAFNTVSGQISTVLNGAFNTASGSYFSTVLNGCCNKFGKKLIIKIY
jgi:hypothetical protein